MEELCGKCDITEWVIGEAGVVKLKEISGGG